MKVEMKHLIDLDNFPIDRLNSQAGQSLIDRCRDEIAQNGMFNLEGFVVDKALTKIVQQLDPELEKHAFVHQREHNIYFRDDIHDIPQNHPALRRNKTTNHTICADQIRNCALNHIYEWPPLTEFLARVMDKKHLYVMDDPLARINVMAYYENEGLNWHFDRSEFTTTLLLQSPESGGIFEYRENLRSDENPNYDNVGRLLEGKDPHVKTMDLNAGTLNVFKGKNTAHRVTAPQGPRPRIVSVFSYFERPGVRFSNQEQEGFYGRVA